MPNVPVLVWLVLAGLAVHRLAQFLAFDEGPFKAALRWRNWMGAYLIDTATGEPATAMGRLALCPYCLGLWLAPLGIVLFAVALLNAWVGIVAQIVLMWLGLAGVQSVLQDFSYLGNRER